jgi:Uma2 family endonuclease
VKKAECATSFFEGEVFEMARASIAHNTIAQNLIFMLHSALRSKKCWVQIEALRLAVESNRHYTYPDMIMSRGSHESHQWHK